MAKPKPATATDATASGAGTDTPNTANAAPKKKGGRPAGPTFGWDSQRDQILVVTLLQNPGVLTPAQLVTNLSQHPAYAADASLLTAEKIRQRVAKLSARAEKMGYGKLQLRRTGGGGYDPNETLASVFKAMGVAPAAPAAMGGVVDAGVQTQAAQAPAVAAPVPVATSQVQSSGLISLIPTPGQ